MVCMLCGLLYFKFIFVFITFFRILDNMPIAWCYETQSGDRYCNPGFPIGCYVAKDGNAHDACVIDVRLYFISKTYLEVQ